MGVGGGYNPNDMTSSYGTGLPGLAPTTGEIPYAMDLSKFNVMAQGRGGGYQAPGMGGFGAGAGIGGGAYNPAGAKLGLNMGTANLALSGLQTIGQLWAAFQANSLAKKSFNFEKGMAETNLANQVRSYNTALEDKARSRAIVEGQSSAETQSYIDKNRATGSIR